METRTELPNIEFEGNICKHLEYEVDSTLRDPSSTPQGIPAQSPHETGIPQGIELPPQNRYGKVVVWMLKPCQQEGIPGTIEQGNYFWKHHPRVQFTMWVFLGKLGYLVRDSWFEIVDEWKAVMRTNLPPAPEEAYLECRQQNY